MRLVLAELAPRTGEVAANVARIGEVVRAAPGGLAAFPELFLGGYRVGDRWRELALRAEDPALEELVRLGRSSRTTIVVGAAVPSVERAGEVENAALVVLPDGRVARQVKRYLPTFGPFEEGLHFTPGAASVPVAAAGIRLGVEICYDVFFPEVTRELAVAGAELLLNISASPTTSRRLFERLLPARAVENGLPVAYVNRVGVEDGLVFGGGSALWDPRGETVALEPVPVPGLAEDERVVAAELDPAAVARWRPFRPVLRDVVARPPSGRPAAP